MGGQKPQRTQVLLDDQISSAVLSDHPLASPGQPQSGSRKTAARKPKGPNSSKKEGWPSEEEIELQVQESLKSFDSHFQYNFQKLHSNQLLVIKDSNFQQELRTNRALNQTLKIVPMEPEEALRRSYTLVSDVY